MRVIAFICPICKLDFDPIIGFICNRCHRLICIFCLSKVINKEVKLCKDCAKETVWSQQDRTTR